MIYDDPAESFQFIAGLINSKVEDTSMDEDDDKERNQKRLMNPTYVKKLMKEDRRITNEIILK